MSTLFAQPYDLHAAGFYFDSEEEYMDKSEKCRNEFGQPVEEFEIQFIDGDNPKIFKAAGISQATIGDWFDDLDHLSDDEAIAIIYLLDNVGMDLSDALSKADEVQVWWGSIRDYAEELVDYCFDLPEIAQRYFDYDSFARDLQIGGDVAEIEPGVWRINASEF
ncbi:hypothetical protein GCM10007160_18460 [Litchfieldella qijiaojingensis]|uniref:Antirestriction protein ArdA n=1 Tax=Litchfieldella qijiaojingensis TaxID=980347 RepID=A0ABQ2YPM4_9GAMM|nr:antirestriction protein ArdA [Halomonas qijiaojingensis]GGX91271.1 hypothetical protein GCM10007160_18460 [Halomonas qijiaojingensis]